MNKKILIGVGVLVILALGMIFPRGNSVVNQIVGAVPTLDGVDNPFVSIGGLRYYYYEQQFTATSSVLCSIKNPLNATSTLLSYSAVATSNGYGSTMNLNLSTSSTAYASSSPYFVKGFVTGTGQWTLYWGGPATTTDTNLIGREAIGVRGNSYVTIAPGDYVNLGVSTTTSISGTFTSYPKGFCRGLFQEI